MIDIGSHPRWLRSPSALQLEYQNLQVLQQWNAEPSCYFISLWNNDFSGVIRSAKQFLFSLSVLCRPKEVPLRWYMVFESQMVCTMVDFYFASCSNLASYIVVNPRYAKHPKLVHNTKQVHHTTYQLPLIHQVPSWMQMNWYILKGQQK